MTSPEALAILAKPENERIDAVADLLRERNSLRAALAECDEADARRARIERLEMTADDKGWCINAHAEVVQLLAQTILAAIRSGTATNYVEHELTATLSFGDLRIIATTYAPGGLSPHQLREQAEQERDALRAILAPLRTLDLNAPLYLDLLRGAPGSPLTVRDITNPEIVAAIKAAQGVTRG